MDNKPDIVNGKRLLDILAHSIQGKQDDEWHLLEKEEEMGERNELVTNCDRFKTLKHSTVTPYAFT